MAVPLREPSVHAYVCRRCLVWCFYNPRDPLDAARAERWVCTHSPGEPNDTHDDEPTLAWSTERLSAPPRA